MLAFADSFNRYGGNIGYLLSGLYANVNRMSLGGDPGGGGNTVLQADNLGGIEFVSVPTPRLDHTAGIAVRLWMSNLPLQDTRSAIIGWNNDASTNIMFVDFTASGRMRVWNNGAVIATSATPVVTANAWWHIELKAVMKTDGTGTFEARVEGLPVIQLTGLTMNGPYAYLAYLGSSVELTQTYPKFKDFVMWDGTGTSNNDFLGSVLVYDLVPNTDVALNWTSTDANGWSVLDNNPPDDAHYLSAAWPAPAASEFGLTDLPADLSSIKGIFTRVRAAKIDGGDGNLQVGVKSGGTAQLGTNRPITVAQTYFQDLFEVDPHTNAPWTPGAVNAMTLTINRTV